jgi:hypothetical protein
MYVTLIYSLSWMTEIRRLPQRGGVSKRTTMTTKTHSHDDVFDDDDETIYWSLLNLV